MRRRFMNTGPPLTIEVIVTKTLGRLFTLSTGYLPTFIKNFPICRNSYCKNMLLLDLTVSKMVIFNCR